MSRLRRCLPGSAAALALSLASAGCFSPTGSVFTTTDGDDTTTTVDSTTQTDPPVTVTGSSTRADEPTGVTTEPTSATSDTDSTSGTDGASSTTQPGTTCGDGFPDPGEGCDDGDANAEDGECKPDCTPATCGDGQRCSACLPVEECDDGNLDVGDGCSDACRLESRLIFLTATRWPGNVTAPQADQICQDLGATHFDPQRNFIAWLSTSMQPISSRIGSSLAPYVLPGGEVVATGTKSLLNGEILHAVDQEPTGTTITGGSDCLNVENLVWTGTSLGGDTTDIHCDDWTALDGQGWAGLFSDPGGQWTQACTFDCSASLRLYCIETAT